MKKERQSHPGPDKERKFVRESKKYAYLEIYDIMCRYEIERGSKILADRLQQCAEQENQEKQELEYRLNKYEEKERKHNRKKATAIVTVICIVLGILLIILFEWISGLEGLGSIWRRALEYMPLLAESILALLKMPKILQDSRIREDREGLSEGMVQWVKNFWQRFLKASSLHILLLCIAVTVASKVIAQCRPIQHLKIFVSNGYVAVVRYDNCNDDDNNNINEYVPIEDGYLVKAVISNDVKQALTQSDDVLIGQLDRAKVTKAQSNMVLKLSGEDYRRLFCWGGNETSKYETQEQLNKIIMTMVKEYCAMKLDNVFDRESDQGGATQDIRKLISQASKNEDLWHSFSDVEERLDLRESVVRIYPKRTLMQLVANDYQELALLMVWYGGKTSTVIYYYGQSILYDFECLKFADNTDRLIQKKLRSIAQRYEDMAYVCPDFEGAEEARRLAAAFRYVADQY